MITTTSSSFSVIVMARFPSLGTMIPVTNAPMKTLVSKGITKYEREDGPKIAWTPITSVKNADPNMRRIMNVMKLFDGPFVIEPVRIATHKTTLLTTRSKNSVHPTQVKRIHRAVRPDPAFTKATLKAKRIHPTISFPTPADKTTIPTVVSRSLSSVRIRHNTGNAVMENATPAKSIKWVN